MHPRLERLLRELGINADTPPDASGWNAILARIGAMLDEEDQARQSLDRSGAVASCEPYDHVVRERSMAAMLEVRVRERTQELQAAVHRLTQNEIVLREIEQRHRYLFEASPLPMLVTVNDSLRIVSANRAALRLYGYEMHEFLAMTSRDLRRPEDVSAFEDHIKRHNFESDVKSEWRHRRKDGTLVDVEVIAHGMLHQGRPARLIMVLDITPRKQAEAALYLSEAKLQENADRLRIAHRAAKMIVLDLDLLTDTIKFSDSAEWLRGPRPAKGGKYPLFKDQVHPDDRHQFLANRQRAIDTLQPQSHEFRFVRTDGEVLWIQSHVTVFAGPDGKAARLVAALRDISDRIRSEVALRNSEQRLRALLDGIPDRAWMKDTQGRYIALNRSESIALGLPAEAVLGRTVLEFRPRDQAERVMAEDAKVMAEGLPRRFEEASNIDGSWREKIKAPIFGADGAVAGMVGMSRDISERKALEAERRERDRVQRRAFVREIHHRIKNHVQGVSGLLNAHARREPMLAPLIQSAVLQLQSVAIVHGLQGVKEGGPLLADLVSAICDSQLGVAQGSAKIEFHDISGIVARLHEDDAVSVALILNELMLNAVKHTEDDSGVKFVAVSLESMEGGARVCVSNAAFLPPAFNRQGEILQGSGLRIIRSLLPPEGAVFDIQTVGHTVCATLELRAPVVTITSVSDEVPFTEGSV